MHKRLEDRNKGLRGEPCLQSGGGRGGAAWGGVTARPEEGGGRKTGSPGQLALSLNERENNSTLTFIENLHT